MNVTHRFPDHWSVQAVDVIYDFLCQLEQDFLNQFGDKLVGYWREEGSFPFENPDNPSTPHVENEATEPEIF